MYDHLVIFAGGLGTRIAEMSHLVPKPMIELGGIPCVLHIMDYYSEFGVNKFTILGGYKVQYIKTYFQNLKLCSGDVLFDYRKTDVNTKASHSLNTRRDWQVEVLDTGALSNTAERLSQLGRSRILGPKGFFLTYGDGLSNIDIAALYKHHQKHDVICTLSAVKPPARFGNLDIKSNGLIESFIEKPQDDEPFINGGFFCAKNEIIQYAGEYKDLMFEEGVLPQLTKRMQLSAYKHNGFWQPMDTMRDKNKLEKLIEEGSAPWLQR